MEPLESHLDTKSDDFRRNSAALQSLVDELNRRVEMIVSGDVRFLVKIDRIL